MKQPCSWRRSNYFIALKTELFWHIFTKFVENLPFLKSLLSSHLNNNLHFWCVAARRHGNGGVEWPGNNTGTSSNQVHSNGGNSILLFHDLKTAEEARGHQQRRRQTAKRMVGLYPCYPRSCCGQTSQSWQRQPLVLRVILNSPPFHAFNVQSDSVCGVKLKSLKICEYGQWKRPTWPMGLDFRRVLVVGLSFWTWVWSENSGVFWVQFWTLS